MNCTNQHNLTTLPTALYIVKFETEITTCNQKNQKVLLLSSIHTLLYNG